MNACRTLWNDESVIATDDGDHASFDRKLCKRSLAIIGRRDFYFCDVIRPRPRHEQPEYVLLRKSPPSAPLRHRNPVVAIPLTNCFCPRKNSTTLGTVANTTAAIR